MRDKVTRASTSPCRRGIAHRPAMDKRGKGSNDLSIQKPRACRAFIGRVFAWQGFPTTGEQSGHYIGAPHRQPVRRLLSHGKFGSTVRVPRASRAWRKYLKEWKELLRHNGRRVARQIRVTNGGGGSGRTTARVSCTSESRPRSRSCVGRQQGAFRRLAEMDRYARLDSYSRLIASRKAIIWAGDFKW
jgi:hypothetical protein